MEIQRDIELAPYTTFKVGGKADYFCIVKNLDELKEAVEYGGKQNLPVLILGGGSNVLISDHGFHGLVVKPEFFGMNFEEDADGAVIARAHSSENWDNFVAECVSRGLYGLENLSGIPGSVGATPIQNVGAYGIEVGNLIIQVHAFDLISCLEKIFSATECRFGYRDSFFKSAEGRNFVIVSVAFRLKKYGNLNHLYKDVANYFAEHVEKEKTLASTREAILQIRARKFPDLSKFGTAGSFFKNPIITTAEFEELKQKYPEITGYPGESGVKVSAAFLIDKIGGWRGKCDGEVCSFDNQALVIVNKGRASASEIKNFTDKIRSNIKTKTGIILENEVSLVGVF
jgi:UDP-N-acetylmuramate dehydrogenase